MVWCPWRSLAAQRTYMSKLDWLFWVGAANKIIDNWTPKERADLRAHYEYLYFNKGNYDFSDFDYKKDDGSTWNLCALFKSGTTVPGYGWSDHKPLDHNKNNMDELEDEENGPMETTVEWVAAAIGFFSAMAAMAAHSNGDILPACILYGLTTICIIVIITSASWTLDIKDELPKANLPKVDWYVIIPIIFFSLLAILLTLILN